MPIAQHIIEQALSEDFPDGEITIRDLVGDQDHYEVIIASALFVGHNKLEQHKMVHKVLKQYIGAELHAISIKTLIK